MLKFPVLEVAKYFSAFFGRDIGALNELFADNLEFVLKGQAMNHSPNEYYNSVFNKKEAVEFIDLYVSKIERIEIQKFETFMYYPKEKTQKFYVRAMQRKNGINFDVIDFVVVEFDEDLKIVKIVHNFATTELPGLNLAKL